LSHEKLTAHYDEQIKASSNRSFGLVFAVVFAVIAALPLLSGGPPHWWALGVSGVFAILAWVAPAVLAPLNRFWTQFGLLLHRLMNPIILGLIFLFTIVPIGLIMRILRKDLLRLKFDPKAPSYWIERNPIGPDPKSLDRQF
jgi:hypothetical protein